MNRKELLEQCQKWHKQAEHRKIIDVLEEMGFDLSIGAEELLENYSGYQMEPDNDPDAVWCADVIAGSSNCMPLIVFRQGPDYITLTGRDGNGNVEPLANFIDAETEGAFEDLGVHPLYSGQRGGALSADRAVERRG